MKIIVLLSLLPVFVACSAAPARTEDYGARTRFYGEYAGKFQVDLESPANLWKDPRQQTIDKMLKGIEPADRPYLENNDGYIYDFTIAECTHHSWTPTNSFLLNAAISLGTFLIWPVGEVESCAYKVRVIDQKRGLASKEYTTEVLVKNELTILNRFGSYRVRDVAGRIATKNLLQEFFEDKDKDFRKREPEHFHKRTPPPVP